MEWTNFFGIYVMLNIIAWGVLMGLTPAIATQRLIKTFLAGAFYVAMVLFALYFGALPGLLSS